MMGSRVKLLKRQISKVACLGYLPYWIGLLRHRIPRRPIPALAPAQHSPQRHVANAMQKLCEALTATETVFPRTDLRMVSILKKGGIIKTCQAVNS